MSQIGRFFKQIWRQVASVQQQDKTERQEKKRRQYEANLRVLNRVADALETGNTQQESSGEKRSFREKLTIVLLSFTTIFTLGADVIFYVQHRDARDALGIAQDTENRQLRAYAYVKPPPVGIQNVVAGQLAYAVIAVRNSGQTPAYNMKMRGNLGVAPYPLLPNQPFREGPYGGAIALNSETETTTGGRVGSTGMQDALRMDDVNEINNGKSKRLYLFGSIAYTDAFGIERTSEYCFAYYGVGPTLTAMDYCDRHNSQN